MSYKQLNNRPVYLVGDLHTNYKEFKEDYDKRGIKDSDFIFLGDTSIIRESDFNQFKKLDKQFDKDGNKGYFLRGNHDNPFLHDVSDYSKHYTTFRPVYTGYTEINGYKGIFLNGATTVNRSLLEEGVNYWKEFDKVDDASSYTDKLDFVIGHTGPLPMDTVWNTDCSRFIIEDKQLAMDLANEQTYLRKLLKQWKPKLWCCGHYHSNYRHHIQEKDFECDVRLIGKNVIVNFSEILCKMNSKKNSQKKS